MWLSLLAAVESLSAPAAPPHHLTVPETLSQLDPVLISLFPFRFFSVRCFGHSDPNVAITQFTNRIEDMVPLEAL